MDIKDALWEDVLTVGRLIAVCFGNLGIAGCICQVHTHKLLTCLVAMTLFRVALAVLAHAAARMAQAVHQRQAALHQRRPVGAHARPSRGASGHLGRMGREPVDRRSQLRHPRLVWLVGRRRTAHFPALLATGRKSGPLSNRPSQRAALQRVRGREQTGRSRHDVLLAQGAQHLQQRRPAVRLLGPVHRRLPRSRLAAVPVCRGLWQLVRDVRPHARGPHAEGARVGALGAGPHGPAPDLRLRSLLQRSETGPDCAARARRCRRRRC